MAKSVDARDSKSLAARRAGSSPAPGTTSTLAKVRGRPSFLIFPLTARLLVFADAAYAATATAREVNEARAALRAGEICRSSLGDAAFERLGRDGARLADPYLAAIALASDDEA